MKAVFLDWATMGPGLDTGPLRALLPDLTIFEVTTEQQVAERIEGAEFVMANKIRLTDALLERCEKLRFIGLTATGTDNVDLDAARRYGVAVCNIRAYCNQSVAEHVFACLLNLTHSIGRYVRDVRAGKWQLADNFCLLTHPVRELSAMTLGIVGYGELGKAVANVGASFGMQVLIATRPGGDTSDDEAGDQRVSFEELLARADVISLHCPLNDNTRNLFGAAEFRKMKGDAILVNTARGGLVDSSALADALRRGDIGGAAVDVLTREPPVHGDPLLDYDGDNLLVTPHIAWASNEARQAAIDELAANIAAFKDGGKRNRVV